MAEVLGDSALSVLDFPGLTSIDVDALAHLAEFDGGLKLNSMSRLSIAQAKILSNGKLKHLELNGLNCNEPKVFSALADFQGQSLSLSALSTLDSRRSFQVRKLSIGLRDLDEDALKPLRRCSFWSFQPWNGSLKTVPSDF